MWRLGGDTGLTLEADPNRCSSKKDLDRERSASPALWAGSRSAMNCGSVLSGKPPALRRGASHFSRCKGRSGQRQRDSARGR
jgi:hypothetical protein